MPGEGGRREEEKNFSVKYLAVPVFHRGFQAIHKQSSTYMSMRLKIELPLSYSFHLSSIKKKILSGLLRPSGFSSEEGKDLKNYHCENRLWFGAFYWLKIVIFNLTNTKLVIATPSARIAQKGD